MFCSPRGTLTSRIPLSAVLLGLHCMRVENCQLQIAHCGLSSRDLYSIKFPNLTLLCFVCLCSFVFCFLFFVFPCCHAHCMHRLHAALLSIAAPVLFCLFPPFSNFASDKEATLPLCTISFIAPARRTWHGTSQS